MTGKNTIAIIIVILVIMLVPVIYFLNKQIILTPGVKEGEIALPQATGNIDDAVDALLKEIDDEQSALNGVEDEKSLIISDSQEISDFSQSINENEF